MATERKGTHLLTIVRDPLERFISGYVDKCIKYVAFTYISVQIGRRAYLCLKINPVKRKMGILSEFLRLEKREWMSFA